MPNPLLRRGAAVSALLAAVLLNAAVCVRAQATATAPVVRPDNTPAEAAETPSGPIQGADVITINVLDHPEFSSRYPVDKDGGIILPLIGQVNVKGLLPTEAGEKIRRALIDKKLLKSPQVAVYIVSRVPKTVTLAGAVGKQGAFTLKEGRTLRLSEVIESVGVLPTSDLTKVVVTRGDKETLVNYLDFRTGAKSGDTVNPTVQDGDQIFVYLTVVPTGAIRVVGEVRTPLPQVALTEGTTAFQVLQQAGGITEFADRSGVYVERGETRIPVPFEDIQKGAREKDIVLQDKDIVRVSRLESGKPQEFTIAGAVNSPGRYPLTTRVTMLEAVTQARGQVEGARLKDTERTRTLPDGTIKTTKMDLKDPKQAAEEVQVGDYIYVPPARNRPRFDPLTALGAASSLLFLFGRR